MNINIESKHLSDGVVVLQPEVFKDERGFFMETFRIDQFQGMGLPTEFVQHNHSGSVKDVVLSMGAWNGKADACSGRFSISRSC
jgi:dTDP-4-dehydrorhamnose 3,5-epimerase-like enzyme